MADRANPEAVNLGEFAWVDDAALVREEVVEPFKVPVRILGRDERRDDATLLVLGQQTARDGKTAWRVMACDGVERHETKACRQEQAGADPECKRRRQPAAWPDSGSGGRNDKAETVGDAAPGKPELDHAFTEDLEVGLVARLRKNSISGRTTEIGNIDQIKAPDPVYRETMENGASWLCHDGN